MVAGVDGRGDERRGLGVGARHGNQVRAWEGLSATYDEKRKRFLFLCHCLVVG